MGIGIIPSSLLNESRTVLENEVTKLKQNNEILKETLDNNNKEIREVKILMKRYVGG